jgi:hypothetical protein
MIRYVFKDTPLTIKNAKKADAQKIGESLQKLQQTHGQRLRPHVVLAAARDKRHPIHRHVEWDDRVAAEAYRLDQVREIIRLIYVKDDHLRPTPMPAFIHVVDKQGAAYRSIYEIQESPNLQLLRLEAFERELASLQQRYREFADFCADVQALREKVRARTHPDRQSEARA